MLRQAITLRPSGDTEMPNLGIGSFPEWGTYYEDLVVSGTCTSTSANHLVSSSSNFTTAGVVAGYIIKNTVSGKQARVQQVVSATDLLVSHNIFSNTDTFEIYTNHGLKITDGYDTLTVVLDVTATEVGAGDLLDVYIDTSFDGVSFVNIGRFNQVLGDDGAKRYVMTFHANPTATSNVVELPTTMGDLTKDIGTQRTARQIGFGDRIRYHAVITEDGNTSEEGPTPVMFTFSLSAYLSKSKERHRKN